MASALLLASSEALSIKSGRSVPVTRRGKYTNHIMWFVAFNLECYTAVLKKNVLQFIM